MSKLSFRARALDASKPLPVFRCEDLPDLHEYASINRAVPQMPTGMEKEEESVRVNSPVRPTARPLALLPAAAAEHQTHTKWPSSSLRRRLSVAGQPFTPPPRPRPPAAAAWRGLLWGHPPTPATYTRVPQSSGARKAQRGHVTKLPAAILWSQLSGWALCIWRGERLGGGGAAARWVPGRTRLHAALQAAGWRSRATSVFARLQRRGAQVLCTPGAFHFSVVWKCGAPWGPA